MLKLMLIRIAQTENNVARKLSGRSVDSPLTETGKTMANSVAALLANIGATAVYSGPAPRCQETARYTAQHLGLPISIREEFQEFDLGDFDGKDRNELNTMVAGRVFLRNPSACVIPGAIEPFVVSQEKAIAGLRELAQQHRNESAVCIFSHGGIMRLILCGLFGIDLSRFWQFRIENCGIFVLNAKDDNSFELVELANHTLTHGQ